MLKNDWVELDRLSHAWANEVADRVLQSAMHAGRCATAHVRLLAGGNDGDTLTIEVGAAQTIYELDSGGGVTPGNVAVTIGGTPAETATNLQAAIDGEQGTLLASAVHGTDTDTIDLRVLAAGTALVLAESTAGARIAAQDNAEEQATGQRYAYRVLRTVTAEDLARGRVRVDTGLSSVEWVLEDVSRAGWDGTVTLVGGIAEFTVGGAFPLQAGDTVEAIALGSA